MDISCFTFHPHPNPPPSRGREFNFEIGSSYLPDFSIHPQLLADCHYLGKLTHCHVLLNKNSLIPWLILVPETEITDLLDLPSAQREHILDECAVISRWI